MPRCRMPRTSSAPPSRTRRRRSPPSSACSTSSHSEPPGMATKVFMEALSPTMEEGLLVAWHKAEGDAVRTGDVLAEVETDKAVMELVARGDGVLRKRLIADGATAPVGQVVAVIGAPDENIDAILGAAATAAPAAAAAVPTSGAAAAPATAPPSAPGAVPAKPPLERRVGGASPIPRAPEQSQGEASAPHQAQLPAVERRTANQEPPAEPRRASPAGAPPAAANGGRVRSSPLARRLASERWLDRGTIAGTGPNGRVVKRDVESAPTVRASRVLRPRVAPA